MNISSGPRVSFELMPNINSPMGLLRNQTQVQKRLRELVAAADAIIIRAVSDLGWIAYNIARELGKPIAMEMAACAWDSTWNHGNPYGKIYAPIRFWRDRTITANADYVLYVSNDFLPSRYPTDGEVVFASNVRIDTPDDEVINHRLERIKDIEESKKPHVIGLIGTLNNRIKGVHTAMEALAIVQRERPGSFVFRNLGHGNPAPYIEMAQKCGIAGYVHFDGIVPSGKQVLDWLDAIDIYIQPSYQEGVPRATIEAMSRGCAVIGSTAGGIPELLEHKWLHKPGDAKALARLILTLLDSAELQITSAGRNFARSKDFTREALMPRRVEFWKNFAKFAAARKIQAGTESAHDRHLSAKTVF